MNRGIDYCQRRSGVGGTRGSPRSGHAYVVSQGSQSDGTQVRGLKALDPMAAERIRDRQSNSMINKILLYTVNTGLITGYVHPAVTLSMTAV